MKNIIVLILIITVTAVASNKITARLQEPIILGDVNRDGKITSLDLDEVKRHILGVEKTDKIRADMNLDNQITIIDLAMIQKYILLGE